MGAGKCGNKIITIIIIIIIIIICNTTETDKAGSCCVEASCVCKQT
jgi:hypothetical protein